MKLHFITTSYPLHDGHMAGQFVQALAQRLHTRGHDLQVWAPNDGSSDTTRDEGGIAVHRFDYPPTGEPKHLVYGNGILPNLKAQPRAVWELPLFLRALKQAGVAAAKHADLVHAHWTLSAIGIPRQSPFVVSARGSDLSGAGGPLVQIPSQRVLRRANGVIAESEALARKARAHSHRVIALGNGVDLERYAHEHNRAALTGSGVENRKTIFLFVGRLNAVKGADRFLSALEALPSELDWGAVCVGEGAFRSRMEASPLADRIHTTGELGTREVVPYYQAADALVLSSRHEGRPNCVLEALSCGLPILAVDIPAVQGLIEHEQTGLIAAPERLAATLAQFMGMRDDWPAYRERARAFAETELDWEKVVDRYEAFYTESLERPPNT